MNSEKQIETENLSFIYESTLKKAAKKKTDSDSSSANIEYNAINNSEEESLKVLKSINLKINAGKFIALLGNTGSGKSTLVRTFNGLIPHFYNGTFFGIVRVLGTDTIETEIKELSKDVGLVFQNPENQLVAMTVERELAFGMENQGIPVDEIQNRIDQILAYLQIEHLRYKHPYELSGGEQQRVAVASILISEPKIIVLDEPTSALDPKSAFQIMEILKKISIDKNITVIIIEHRLDVIIPYCDEIILMQDGKILQHDTVDNILNDNLIYQLEIEVPRYIEFFHELKSHEKFEGKIPKNLEEAAIRLEEILSK